VHLVRNYAKALLSWVEHLGHAHQEAVIGGVVPGHAGVAGSVGNVGHLGFFFSGDGKGRKKKKKRET